MELSHFAHPGMGKAFCGLPLGPDVVAYDTISYDDKPAGWCPVCLAAFLDPQPTRTNETGETE